MSTRRVTRSKSKRRPNYAAKPTAKSLRLWAEIGDWLGLFNDGLTVSELANALGIGRQLCLYHVKRLAASKGLVMVLEPCLDNGGLRFRVWSDHSIMAHYVRRFSEPRIELVAAQRQAA